MRISQRKTTVGLSVAATLAVMLLAAATATASVSAQFTGQFGWNVNETKQLAGPGTYTQAEMNLCTVTEVNSLTEPVTCKAGEQTAESGGFKFPEGVATGPAPNNYV